MANKQFVVNHDNVHPNTGGTFWSIWICDTYAGRPVTGLVVGDLGIMLDQARIYFANSTTTWAASISGSSGYFTGDITIIGSLSIGNSGSNYSYFISAATGPEILIIPSDPGGTLITDYAVQTLYDKTLDGPTIVAPLLVTTSGTGVVRIGEFGGGNAYGAIGLAGDISGSGYHMASSPGDPNLYFNRAAGYGVYWSIAGTPQMILLPGGALTGKMDTMTYAATITLDVTLGNTHKTTLTGNATINASAAGAGDQHMTVILVNDATLARTTTFGTNFRSAGVVVGTISKVAVVKFVSDGAAWFEESRTLAL